MDNYKVQIFKITLTAFPYEQSIQKSLTSPKKSEAFIILCQRGNKDKLLLSFSVHFAILLLLIFLLAIALFLQVRRIFITLLLKGFALVVGIANGDRAVVHFGQLIQLVY